MGQNVNEVFQEWWEKEVCMNGDTSVYQAFVNGWFKGFQNSQKNSMEREKLIFDAIRPLVHNLDDIIVNTLVTK